MPPVLSYSHDVQESGHVWHIHYLLRNSKYWFKLQVGLDFSTAERHYWVLVSFENPSLHVGQLTLDPVLYGSANKHLAHPVGHYEHFAIYDNGSVSALYSKY